MCEMMPVDSSVGRSAWTWYVQCVGLVVGEALERNRRDPAMKYSTAQYDETAFGKRKYQRGRRVRKCGVQWALTAVDVDVDGKTRAVDIQFLPFNKRTVETISPMIVQRMKVGGTISTDLWKAYPAAADLSRFKWKRQFCTCAKNMLDFEGF